VRFALRRESPQPYEPEVYANLEDVNEAGEFRATVPTYPCGTVVRWLAACGDGSIHEGYGRVVAQGADEHGAYMRVLKMGEETIR
jgi:hypothetical protein